MKEEDPGVVKRSRGDLNPKEFTQRKKSCDALSATAGRLHMAANRLSVRLASANLSPEQLCAFIDELAPLLSDAALRVAEEHANRLVVQPEWVLSEVLLSPDLVPHILAQLPTKAHAAKGTCRAWRRGWKETLARRERPRLVVIGGEDSEGEFPSSLERYDPSTNEWEEEAVAPMPTARRYVRTGVLLDGKLYVAGGQDEADGATSNLAERYDLATKSWESVVPMATPRENHAVAVHDGKVYAVGGFSDGVGRLSSVERYDPATNAWEAVAPMAADRAAVSVAALDGKLYAVGGFDGGGGRLSSVERYDPTANAWEAVAPLAAARANLATAVLDGKLYVVGGFNDVDGLLSSVERYDPALDAWEAVAPLAAARANPAAAVLDGKLYVVGGNNENEDFSSFERYDPATNAWEAAAPLTTARSFHGISVA